MLRSLITLSLIAFSSIASAQSIDFPGPGIPGGVIARQVGCVPTNNMVGATFGMIIFSQAVNPAENIKGGFFTKTGVYPGALTSQFAMSVVKQDVYTAELAVPDMGLRVELNKLQNTAKVYYVNRSLPAYTCGYAQ